MVSAAPRAASSPTMTKKVSPAMIPASVFVALLLLRRRFAMNRAGQLLGIHRAIGNRRQSLFAFGAGGEQTFGGCRW